MVTTIVLAAVVLLAAVLVLRFAFPGALVAMLRLGARRIAGLEQRSVVVDGITWPYLEGGPASGEVLVLVHGFSGDKDNWPLYARHFRRHCRVICPDLVGFGDNVVDPAADYRLAAQADRLMRFVDALGIDRLHIAGNSMGGGIALSCAISYPSRMITVTLLNNAGVNSVNKSEVEIAAGRGESLLVPSNMREVYELFDFITYKRMPVPGIIKRDIGETLLERRDFLETAFWSLYRDIQTRPMDDRLDEVTAPTLIIWGRHDRVIDVSCTEIMRDRIPNNECIIFEDVGHVPMLECPGRVASVHLDHINRHCAA